MINENKFVEIYAGELWQSTMIKDLLEDNGIPAFIENELMGTIIPYQISSGGVAPVCVKVESSDFERAKELIDEFNNANFSLEDEVE